MIRPDLPVEALAGLPGGPDPVVLCASARLALDLRRAHGALCAARGAPTWRALQSSTPALWLDALVSRALLRGEIPPNAVSGSFLGVAQERTLWELAIARDAGPAAELFDREGMAIEAMSAASTFRHWRIDVPEPMQSAEYRAWARWREDVSGVCQKDGWRGIDDILAWRIDCVERGIGGLPTRIGLAGFVLPDPMLERLLRVLDGRGVALFRLDFGHGTPNPPLALGCPDAEAECVAAAEWARARLALKPNDRLRIAVAGLPQRRRLIDAALTDALRRLPESVAHVFVDGEPLSEQALVATALSLLQIYAAPRKLAQADLGPLLREPGWAADIDEAEAMAGIEVALRSTMPAEASLDRYSREIARLPEGSLAPRLVAALGVLADAVRLATRRQPPSAWAEAFLDVLDRVGWPGQRPLRAAEAAAMIQFRERIADLAALDGLLGRVDRAEALRRLRIQCRDLPFHAPQRKAARVEICDLDAAVAGAVDGLWVMGLNEAEWPPAPRPNALIPAELQRRAGVPSACADVLASAARATQSLWLTSAGEVTLSWARQSGERPLRPSPLLAGIAATETESAPVFLPEPGRIEVIDDARGPALRPGEKVLGGTALLAAQAACPAWAFHQFRLGAAVLPEPTFGLDAMARGTLLHRALESFWRGRGSGWLAALSPAEREAEVERVVEHALEFHDRDAPVALPPRLRLLEARRLRQLLAGWLELEATRPAFRVRACEERHTIDIEGLPVRVVVDRVDELDDGRLAIIDYKTGRSDRSSSWAAARIVEPQLPIYAALVFPERDVAAVALARVTREHPAFLGVASDPALLPGVDALDAQRRRYAEADFPDWAGLRLAWAERIRGVAREFREGMADVAYAHAKDLAHCPVLPLLRLAEKGGGLEDGE